jgi:signal transduction histidine kinase
MVRRRDRIRRMGTWLVLVGALAVAIAFTWLRATDPSDGARVSFYGDGWSSAGIVIAPIDAPAPGLQSGDLVSAVDGRSMEAWLADATNREATRPTALVPMPYAIVRDGAPQSAEVTWTAPAVGATLLAGWSVILFSIAVAVTAAFVYARRPEVPAATALAIGAAGAAGSSVPWFLGTTVSGVVQGSPFVLHSLLTGPLYMLLWPAALHLALVFPIPAPVVARHRWLIPPVYAASFAAYGLALLAARLATSTNLEWVGTWPTAQLVVIVPFIVLSLAALLVTARRTRDPEARTQLRWAWLGLMWGLGLGLLLFMLPELVIGRSLLPDSWIGLTALPVPFALTAAILRDHLFDIDVVVRRTFVYGTLTLGVIATYVAVVASIGAMVGPDHGPAVELFATGIAALIALPLRDILQRAVNRLLYGERDEPWRAMRRLGQRLDLAVDPDRTFPAIVDTVAEALRAPYVRLDVVDERGAAVPVAIRGRGASVTVDVPIDHGAERVGTFVLGVRAGEPGYRADELELLGDLARQAGGAIHALRLRADLARSHERLLLAREEERRRLRHDLHDGLGPSLAAIGMRAEAATELLETDPAAARALLAELGADVHATLSDIRRLVEGLRPPALDELGLEGAIAQQAERLEGSAAGGMPGTIISVTALPSPLPELPAAVEVAAYRIAIEALTHAVRHAAATTCRVRQRVADDLLLVEVVDDGAGLPESVARGTGLESMETRAAELGGSVRLARRRSGGTRISARLPLLPGMAGAIMLPSALAAGERPTEPTTEATPS